MGRKPAPSGAPHRTQKFLPLGVCRPTTGAGRHRRLPHARGHHAAASTIIGRTVPDPPACHSETDARRCSRAALVVVQFGQAGRHYGKRSLGVRRRHTTTGRRNRSCEPTNGRRGDKSTRNVSPELANKVYGDARAPADRRATESPRGCGNRRYRGRRSAHQRPAGSARRPHLATRSLKESSASASAYIEDGIRAGPGV